MTRSMQLDALNHILLEEMPQYRTWAETFSADDISQRRLLLFDECPTAPAAITCFLGNSG